MSENLNVTENYLLQQMQQMAASMTALPQAGGSKDTGDGKSFQDMIEKVNEKAEPGKEPPEKPVEKQEAAEKDETAAPPRDEKEELKAENLTAAPGVVGYVDLFRPEIAPVEEETAAVPVLTEISPETAERPETAVQAPVLETEAEAVETVDAPETVQADFRETLEEAPPQQAEAPVEQKTEVRQLERAAEVEEVREELPETEVEVIRSEEDSDEPQAEAVEVEEPVFHDVKAAPVKVGETYKAVDTREPDMDEKLADTIQQAVQSGSQRVEIRLTPENLGTLTIEMTKDASGALQVVLHASNSRAAGLLSQHVDGLHSALQNYSQEPVQIEVQRGEESQRQSFHQQADPDGRGQNRQQQERHEEQQTDSGDFLQKMRLGLFGTDETL